LQGNKAIDFKIKRGEVVVIGWKKYQKAELTDLEELRNRIREIKKRKKGNYKRLTNQSNKRR
jgi:hypothetical protein